MIQELLNLIAYSSHRFGVLIEVRDAVTKQAIDPEWLRQMHKEEACRKMAMAVVEMADWEQTRSDEDRLERIRCEAFIYNRESIRSLVLKAYSIGYARGAQDKKSLV